MPRYYFDMREGDEVAVDEEGMEFSSMEAVRREAAHTLADMARDAIGGRAKGEIRLMAVEVRDDSGSVLRLRFQVAIDEG
jgi:hypothetical protein